MLDRRVINFFRSLSAGAFWRLFIDYNRQAEVGPTGFDYKEPGYLESMFRGFDFMLSTIGSRVTPEYLFELHRHSISMVQTKLLGEASSGDGKEEVVVVYQPFAPNFSTEYVSFGLIVDGTTQNVTRAGLRELLVKLAVGADFAIQSWDITLLIDKHHVPSTITDEYVEEVFTKLCDAEHACQVMLPCRTNQVIIGMIKRILSNYYHNKIETTDDKIRAIVICVHELELLHPFCDANCRTIVMLLLNKLLIEQGLSPTVLTNPNRFDAFSIDELCQEVKDGVTRFAGLSTVKYVGTEPVLYVNGNLSVCELLIREMCGTCKHWDLVKESERGRVYRVIQDVLSGIQQPLAAQQIATIAKIVHGELDSAIYKKSALQKMLPHNFCFFAGGSVDYGVHFGVGEKEFDGGKLQEVIKRVCSELFESPLKDRSSSFFSASHMGSCR